MRASMLAGEFGGGEERRFVRDIRRRLGRPTFKVEQVSQTTVRYLEGRTRGAATGFVVGGHRRLNTFMAMGRSAAPRRVRSCVRRRRRARPAPGRRRGGVRGIGGLTENSLGCQQFGGETVLTPSYGATPVGEKPRGVGVLRKQRESGISRVRVVARAQQDILLFRPRGPPRDGIRSGCFGVGCAGVGEGRSAATRRSGAPGRSQSNAKPSFSGLGGPRSWQKGRCSIECLPRANTPRAEPL